MTESNRVISGSLFILASIAVAFILNFSQPIMIPFILALLLRILIDPIIDFQTINLRVHRFIAVFISICLIVLLESLVSVLVIDCTLIGLSPPTSTFPTLTTLVFLLRISLKGLILIFLNQILYEAH